MNFAKPLVQGLKESYDATAHYSRAMGNIGRKAAGTEGRMIAEGVDRAAAQIDMNVIQPAKAMGRDAINFTARKLDQAGAAVETAGLVTLGLGIEAGQAIKTGAEDAGRAIVSGAKVAGRAVEDAGLVTLGLGIEAGHAIKTGAEDAGRAIVSGAKAAGREVRFEARELGTAARKAGERGVQALDNVRIAADNAAFGARTFVKDEALQVQNNVAHKSIHLGDKLLHWGEKHKVV
jgi:hypothetical protein